MSYIWNKLDCLFSVPLKQLKMTKSLVHKLMLQVCSNSLWINKLVVILFNLIQNHRVCIPQIAKTLA